MDQSIRPMTDAERELHIQSCAVLIEAAMDRYAESNCFTDRAEADRWRLDMEDAIRGRSAERVAVMELEMGLTQ